MQKNKHIKFNRASSRPDMDGPSKMSCHSWGNAISAPAYFMGHAGPLLRRPDQLASYTGIRLDEGSHQASGGASCIV
jgi:hypothetical protein